MRVNKPFSALITLVFIISLVILNFPSSSMAVSSLYSPKASNHHLVNRKDDISKILSVLEKKTGDRKLVEKAKDKLLTLNEGRIRLISSLCERTSHDSYSAGANIAFLLSITLIIFS